MTAENKFIINDGPVFEEYLTLNREKRIMSHFLNGEYLQRLAIVREERTNVDYLEYDRFKNDLWAGLMIHSAYPGTDLHDFFLGRHMGGGKLHGIYYVRGNPYPTYYSQVEEDSKAPYVDIGTPIDWERMGKAKIVDLSRTSVAKLDDPNHENSFVSRLIAAPFAPTAEVSINNKFEREDTMQLDTAYILDAAVYEYFLIKGQEVLNAPFFSAEKAGDFCEELQIAFSEYFPMQ